MGVSTRPTCRTNQVFWLKKTPRCVPSWCAGTSLSMVECSPAMASFRGCPPLTRAAAARAGTPGLGTAAIATVDDLATTPVAARPPRSSKTARHQVPRSYWEERQRCSIGFLPLHSSGRGWSRRKPSAWSSSVSRSPWKQGLKIITRGWNASQRPPPFFSLLKLGRHSPFPRASCQLHEWHEERPSTDDNDTSL